MESSLILNRVASGLNLGPITGFDSTLLQLELKRHERKRNFMRYGTFLDEEEEAVPPKPIEKSKVTEVKDRMGNTLYKRGEKNQEKYARDLDQWLKKMKCSGATGMRLEQFKDIKVGVLPDPVLYKSPSIEPFPNLRDETYTYKGGKDREGNLNGKGCIELENGDLITGYFVDNKRHGEFTIETFKNGLRIIQGPYVNDKMNGRTRVTYNNGTFCEVYMKDGVMHGFYRSFDEKGRLKFIGNYKNGSPTGVCWKVIPGGGCVVGRVDDEGELTGIRIAYLYPDFITAFVGNFNQGIMEFAQVAELKSVIDDKGIKVPMFTEPNGRLYKREISTYDFVTNNPLLPDPYESKLVEIRPSRVGGAGDGLFAKVKIEANVVVAFYNGKRIGPRSWEDFNHPDWSYNAYKIFDPAIHNGTIDIPSEYRETKNYNATLAHKTNHSFLPNGEFVSFDHPRLGIIPCICTSHDVEAGEEIFVHYGYSFNDCPDWYEEAWQSGSYPIPDSMRDGYTGNPEFTNDDKANQLPDMDDKSSQEGSQDGSQG